MLEEINGNDMRDNMREANTQLCARACFDQGWDVAPQLRYFIDDGTFSDDTNATSAVITELVCAGAFEGAGRCYEVAAAERGTGTAWLALEASGYIRRMHVEDADSDAHVEGNIKFA